MIRAAFRALARKHHPDAGGDARRMMALTDAWRVLGDRRARARYDAARAVQLAMVANAAAGAGGRHGDRARAGAAVRIDARRRVRPASRPRGLQRAAAHRRGRDRPRLRALCRLVDPRAGPPRPGLPRVAEADLDRTTAHLGDRAAPRRHRGEPGRPRSGRPRYRGSAGRSSGGRELAVGRSARSGNVVRPTGRAVVRRSRSVRWDPGSQERRRMPDGHAFDERSDHLSAAARASGSRGPSPTPDLGGPIPGSRSPATPDCRCGRRPRRSSRRSSARPAIAPSSSDSESSGSRTATPEGAPADVWPGADR